MQVEFHFDFGSPNAYLSHRVIPAIEARTGARFRYVPVLLGGVFKATGNRSPAEAFAGIRNKPDYERLETERFIRRHRIEGFTRNPFFPVNTLHLMRGAAAAEIDGGLDRYVNAMFHHMWEAPKKLDEPDVLRDALTASGLDARRHHGSDPGPRGQGPAARQHGSLRRPRQLRLPHLLRRRRDLFRQGPAARRGGGHPGHSLTNTA